jgi:hypothetical protein
MRALNAQVGKGRMNYASACIPSLNLHPPPLYTSESFASVSGERRDEIFLCMPPVP